MTNKTHGVLILACSLLIGSLLSCTSNTPLQVAFVAPLSGPNSSLGVDGRQGFILALEQLAWKRPLEVSWLDDQANATLCLNLVQEALDRGIKHFVFHTTSGAALEAINLVNQHKAFAVSATVSAAELTGKDDYFFRSGLSNHLYGIEIMNLVSSAAQAEQRPLKTRAAPVLIGDQSNEAYVQAIISAINEGLALQEAPPLRRLAFDTREGFSPLELAQELATQTDIPAIILIANPLDSARLAQNIRKLGITAPFFLAPWGLNMEFIVNGGSAAEGTMGMSVVELSIDNPEFLNFAQAYRTRHGSDPSYFAQYGYEVAWMVNTLLSRNPNPEPTKLKKFLSKGYRFPGLVRDIVVDNLGDGRADMFYYKVMDGAFVLQGSSRSQN